MRYSGRELFIAERRPSGRYVSRIITNIQREVEARGVQSVESILLRVKSRLVQLSAQITGACNKFVAQFEQGSQLLLQCPVFFAEMPGSRRQVIGHF